MAAPCKCKIEPCYSDDAECKLRHQTSEGVQAFKIVHCPDHAQAMRALESLTPSGSEFVGDVARCVAFVRDKQSTMMQHIITMHKRNNILTEKMRELVSCYSQEIEAHYRSAPTFLPVRRALVLEVHKLLKQATPEGDS